MGERALDVGLIDGFADIDSLVRKLGGARLKTRTFRPRRRGLLRRLPGLVVDASSVLVLKNCGPKGYPGFPEVGNFALPAKLLKQGVTDMVRISDARMSGTAYGTVVLHTAPEAAAGGPLALVQNGDLIELDVAKRKIHLHVSAAELARRRAKWKPPKPHSDRGWVKLYCDTVQQADKGVDLDFLVGKSGAKVGRESH